MTTHLIGINGYARAGKDTASRVFTDAGWRRDAFANRMRDFLYAQNPIVYLLSVGVTVRLRYIVDEIGWERAKTEYPEVADLLLRTGTEAGRGVLGEYVWVDALLANWSSGEGLVITDCRFPNEAQMIRSLRGKVIRIERRGVGPRTLSDGTDHPSDTALDGYAFDAVFHNDAGPEYLHQAVGEWARRKELIK